MKKNGRNLSRNEVESDMQLTIGGSRREKVTIDGEGRRRKV